MLLSSKSARNPGHYRLFVSTGTRPGQMQKFRDCPGHSGALGNYEILSSIRYLARQSLALRGRDDDSDGNLIQLLKLQGSEDSEILEWMQRKTNKYTSPEMQNELIKHLALHVMRDISEKLQKSPFFQLLMERSSRESELTCRPRKLTKSRM